MKRILPLGLITMWAAFGAWETVGSQVPERTPAQKRILMERGEKVKGQRLRLVQQVIESYQGCQVIAEGNELTGLIINGKEYREFTLIIREPKKTIIVVTADGVVSFDY